MRQEYRKKYGMILDAEESFSRGVALGLWVKRPLSTWHFLLPGMFIFDSVRRSQAVREYSAVFLYPRKVALEAALEMIGGVDRERVVSMAENKIQEWLSAQKVYSPRVLCGHMEQIRILLDHYSRLLRAEGESYSRLIRSLYGTRENYEGYLTRLSTAEGEVDQGLAEIQGGTAESWDRLRAEQVQVAQLRQKEVERIFPEEG